MEVEVGTDAQQGDGAEHVVDKLAELGLQVSLPIPEDQHQDGSTEQQDADGEEDVDGLRRQGHHEGADDSDQHKKCRKQADH